MSSGNAKHDRRKIRRAIGPQAANALLTMEERSIDIDRFLLLRHSFWRRVRWFLTGRF